MTKDIRFATIDEYITQFSPDIQERLQLTRAAIKQAVPDAAEKISWAMPTFYLNGNLVHFAAFKTHVGFFPGADGIEAFKEKLKDYSYSKGGVQFPFVKPLPVALIGEIVRFRAAQNSAYILKKRGSKETEANASHPQTYKKDGITAL
jgi:uncharacterized protein YdhG (YjbR/CyaY superfamily)